jgi:glutamine synthetase
MTGLRPGAEGMMSVPRPFSHHRGEQERAADAQRAEVAARQLAGRASSVATVFVDHSGAARVKVVPVTGLAAAARSGLGFSPVIDAFTSDGGIDPSSPLDKPDGDLRLVPDLDRIAVLAEPPGWAFVPGDRFHQDGTVYACCQRSFARAQVAAAASKGISALMAFEVEWMVGRDTVGGDTVGSDTVDFAPAFGGTGYGLSRLIGSADYVRDVLAALEAAGVRVEQIHPEYGPAQFEVSVTAQDPVSAADTCVLVKFVIAAVSARHGLRASFAPAVFTDNVGNGGHLHASFWQDGHNLFSGGSGRHGLTNTGESIIAGLLEALPALLAVGAPSPASYRRLQPSRWAGAFQIWGAENREAAVRFIAASPADPGAANVELKCFDLSANPYLLTGAVLAIAIASSDRQARLPDEVSGDPAVPGHPLAGRAVRLPGSLAEAVTALEASEDLRKAAGDQLIRTFAASRRAEIGLADGQPDDVIIARARWLS